MPDQDLTSLDALKPDGQVEQVLTLDDVEHETRRKLKAWADVEHSLLDGGHTVVVSTTAPATPTNWQLWFNSETGELLIYHDDYDRWVTVEQPTFNYLYNSSFSRFPNATSLPVGWYKYGTSTTGTAVPAGTGLTNTRQKFGPYSLAVNSGDGYLRVYQYVVKPSSQFGPMSYWKGRTVSLGCWVWANVAGAVYMFVSTDVGSYSPSVYHPGDSTWRWIVVTQKVTTEPTATGMAVSLNVDLPATNANFSAPTFVEGSWCPHVIPSNLLLRSELLHMGSASGALDTIPGGSIYYGPQGSSTSWYFVTTVAPFRCLISNMRLYVTHGAGAGQTYTGTLQVNGADTGVTCNIVDTNTFNFDNANKVEVNPGAFVGLRVTGTGGANVSAVRASFLVEEVPQLLA